jgi:hypothetical protein
MKTAPRDRDAAIFSLAAFGMSPAVAAMVLAGPDAREPKRGWNVAGKEAIARHMGRVGERVRRLAGGKAGRS